MSDSYLGEIQIFAGDYAPVGYYKCEGGLVEISQNQALYAILGTTYGGDGRINFGLPNLAGRSPMHVGGSSGAGPGLEYHILGQMAGSFQVELNSDHMPSHTHGVNGNDIGGDENTDIADRSFAKSWFAPRPSRSRDVNMYGDSEPKEATLADDTLTYNQAGQGGHYNLQPYLPVTFIICADGLFPPRN